jgi:hypothetical protein
MEVFARRRTHAVWMIVPGATAHHTVLGVSDVIIVLLFTRVKLIAPARTGPFLNVTRHIVQSKWIRIKGFSRRSLFFIPLSPASIAIGIVITNVIAPWIGCLISCACSILPFGFSWQGALKPGKSGLFVQSFKSAV